jgi:hypothetical protein
MTLLSHQLLRERAYGSRDFETAEAQKACTKQGRAIATRVTKSSAGVDADRGKAEDREQSGRWYRQTGRRQLKSKEKQR